MLAGDRHNGVHVAGIAGQMDDDDGLRPFGNARFERCRVKIVRIGQNIRKYGNRILIQNADDGPLIGDGAGDYLISGCDACRAQRDMNGGGA
ncbi:hypothetical protein D3C71_1926450 [compost metagenome]